MTPELLRFVALLCGGLFAAGGFAIWIYRNAGLLTWGWAIIALAPGFIGLGGVWALTQGVVTLGELMILIVLALLLSAVMVLRTLWTRPKGDEKPDISAFD